MYIPASLNTDDVIARALRSGHAKVSFSQLGEDGTLWWMFDDRKNGFYVDVGCHHPYRFSNTAALHIFNSWKGINIDVDDRAVAAFEADRPRDINILGAVGLTAGQAEVTLFEEGAVNTLDPRRARDPNWQHSLREKRMVEMNTLAYFLDRYLPDGQAIDLLNIDAEGLDYDCLSSNNWAKYRPEVISIEAHGFDINAPASHPTFQLLRKEGYGLVSHVVVTSIYRKIKG